MPITTKQRIQEHLADPVSQAYIANRIAQIDKQVRNKAMPNTYQLTSQIWEQIKRIEQAKGIKIEVESDYCWVSYNFIDVDDVVKNKIEKLSYFEVKKWHGKPIKAISEPQIKDILIALQKILGRNPEIYKKDVLLKKVFDLKIEEPHYNEYNKGLSFGKIEAEKNAMPWSQSQALYQKWCGGWPKSRLQTEPEKVLSELLEILKGVK